jgi:hypothetical protein
MSDGLITLRAPGSTSVIVERLDSGSISVPISVTSGDDDYTPLTVFSGDGYADDAAFRAQIPSLTTNTAVDPGLAGTGTYPNTRWSDGLGVDLISLDSTVLYNGHRTWKRRIVRDPSGEATPFYGMLGYYFDNIVDDLTTTTLTDMWVRRKLLFQSPFSTVGVGGPGANALKVGPHIHEQVSGSRAGCSISNTDLFALECYWGTPTEVNIGYHVGSTAFMDDNWYDQIYHIGVGDAGKVRQTMWMNIDGLTPVLRGDEQAVAVAPIIDSVDIFGQNMNQNMNVGEEQVYWIAEIEIVDGSVYPNPFGLTI